MKPIVEHYRDILSDEIVYQIKIPRLYLVQAKYPRLSIIWWLIKTTWHVRKEQS